MSQTAGRLVRPSGQASTVPLWTAWILAVTVGAASAQTLTIVPTFSIVETLTDNRGSQSASKEWDLITQVSPGLSVNARRGAMQGSLTYSLNGLAYASDSSLNSVFHRLSSSGQVSFLEGRAGVRASASAARSQVSAFGAPTSSPSTSTSNQAQTISYSLSPYLSGVLLGEVRYSTTLTASGSSSDAAGGQGDSRQLAFTANLGGTSGRLSWSAGLTSQQADQAAGTSSAQRTGQAVLGLTFTPDVDWNFSLRAGQELDNIRTGSSDQGATWGYGAAWLPGPRTTLKFESDRRFFGRSHSLQFSHRMARSVWTLSDTRNLNTTGVAGRAEVPLYDMLYALSREPDPAKRDLEVRALLEQQGVSPDQKVVVGGFLTSAATVDRRQQASFSYQGLRLTWSLSLFIGRTSRASSEASATDDLSGGDVRQRGITSSLAYRLSPRDSLAVSVQQQRTLGNGMRAGTDLKSVLATWSSTLGRYASGSLALRHSVSDGDASGYTENALIGSIQIRF